MFVNRLVDHSQIWIAALILGFTVPISLLCSRLLCSLLCLEERTIARNMAQLGSKARHLGTSLHSLLEHPLHIDEFLMVPSVRRRRHLRGVGTFGLGQKDITLTHSIFWRNLGEWALIVYLAQLGEARAFWHVLSPAIGRFKVIEGTSRALVNVTVSRLELP